VPEGIHSVHHFRDYLLHAFLDFVNIFHHAYDTPILCTCRSDNPQAHGWRHKSGHLGLRHTALTLYLPSHCQFMHGSHHSQYTCCGLHFLRHPAKSPATSSGVSAQIGHVMLASHAAMPESSYPIPSFGPHSYANKLFRKQIIPLP